MHLLLLALSAICAAEETACTWSWYSLGCVPKASCSHKWKIRWGKLGDCVAKEVPAEASSSSEPETPAPAAAVEEETPAAAVEETPAAAEEDVAIEEEPEKEPEKDEA